MPTEGILSEIEPAKHSFGLDELSCQDLLNYVEKYRVPLKSHQLPTSTLTKEDCINALELFISSIKASSEESFLSIPTSDARLLLEAEEFTNTCYKKELENLIDEEKLWKEMKLVEIKGLFRSLTGSVCSLNKQDAIEATMKRCHEILSNSDVKQVINIYVNHCRDIGVSSKSIIQNLPEILLENKEATADPIDNILYTDIRNKLNIRDLSSKKKSVLEYRDGKDIYSNLPFDQLSNPHVDHIVERQLMAYTITTSGIGVQPCSNNAIINPIKNIVNDKANLNVTSCDLNVTKGSAVTQWIREDRKTNHPRDLHVLLYNSTNGRERKIGKYTANVISALDQCFNLVEADIRYLRRLDGHVTGSQFEQVAERLSELHKKTGVEKFQQYGRVTRSKVKESL